MTLCLPKRSKGTAASVWSLARSVVVGNMLSTRRTVDAPKQKWQCTPATGQAASLTLLKNVCTKEISRVPFALWRTSIAEASQGLAVRGRVKLVVQCSACCWNSRVTTTTVPSPLDCEISNICKVFFLWYQIHLEAASLSDVQNNRYKIL